MYTLNFLKKLKEMYYNFTKRSSYMNTEKLGKINQSATMKSRLTKYNHSFVIRKLTPAMLITALTFNCTPININLFNQDVYASDGTRLSGRSIDDIVYAYGPTLPDARSTYWQRMPKALFRGKYPFTWDGNFPSTVSLYLDMYGHDNEDDYIHLATYPTDKNYYENFSPDFYPVSSDIFPFNFTEEEKYSRGRYTEYSVSVTDLRTGAKSDKCIYAQKNYPYTYEGLRNQISTFAVAFDFPRDKVLNDIRDALVNNDASKMNSIADSIQYIYDNGNQILQYKVRALPQGLRNLAENINTYHHLRNDYVSKINSLSDKVLVDNLIDSAELYDYQKQDLHNQVNEKVAHLGSAIIPSVTPINTAETTYGRASNIGITINNTGSSEPFTVVKPDGTNVSVVAPTTVYFPVTCNGTYTFYTSSPTGQMIATPIVVTSYRDAPNITVTPSTTGVTDMPVTLSIAAICQDEISSLSVTNPDGATQVIGRATGTYTAEKNGTYTVTVKTNHSTNNTYTKTYTVNNIIGSTLVDCTSNAVTEPYDVYANTSSELTSAGLENTQATRVKAVDITLNFNPTKDNTGNPLVYKVSSDHLGSAREVTSGQFVDTVNQNGTYIYEITTPAGKTITKTVTVNSIQEVPTIDLSYDINPTTNKADISITADSVDGIQKILDSNGHSLGSDSTTTSVSSNGYYTFTVISKNGSRKSKVIKINSIPDKPEITFHETPVGDPIQKVRFYPTVQTIYGIASVTTPSGDVIDYTDKNHAGTYNLSDIEFEATSNGTYTYIIKDTNGSIYHADYVVDTISKLPSINFSLSEEDWTSEVPITLNVCVKDNSDSGLLAVRISQTLEGETSSRIVKSYRPGTNPREYTVDIPVSENAVYKVEVWDGTQTIDDEPTVGRKRVMNIDTEKPTLHVTTDSNSDTWYNEVTYHVTANDNYGVKNIKCDNGLVIEGSEGDFTFNHNGTYRITAYDYAGNSSEEEAVEVSNIETGDPTINIIQDSYGNLTTPVTLKLTFYNAISPIKTITYPDGTTTDISDQKKNIYQTTFAIPDNGLYEFKVTNMLDHEAAASIQITTVDKNPPTIDVTSSTDSWVKDKVTLTVTASDDKGDPNILLPNGQLKTSTTSATFDATENGEYTFTATDKAGNITVTKYTVNNIDNKKPLPPTLAYEDKLLTATFSIPVSGLTGYVFTCNQITETGETVLIKRAENTFDSTIYPNEHTTQQVALDLSELNLEVGKTYSLTLAAKNGVDVYSDNAVLVTFIKFAYDNVKTDVDDKYKNNPTTSTIQEIIQDILDALKTISKDDPDYPKYIELYKDYLQKYIDTINKEINTDTLKTSTDIQDSLDKLNKAMADLTQYKTDLPSTYDTYENAKKALESYLAALQIDTTTSLDQLQQLLSKLEQLKVTYDKVPTEELSDKCKEFLNTKVAETITDLLNQAAEYPNTKDSYQAVLDLIKQLENLNTFASHMSDTNKELLNSSIQTILDKLQQIIITTGTGAVASNPADVDITDLLKQLEDLKKTLEEVGCDNATQTVLEVITKYIDTIKNNPSTPKDVYDKLINYLKELLDKLPNGSAEKELIDKLIEQIDKIKAYNPTSPSKPSTDGSSTGDSSTGSSSDAGGSGSGGSSGSGSNTTEKSEQSQSVTYKVKVTIEQNSLNAISTYTVKANADFTLPIKVPEGYKIDEVLINNKPVTISDNTLVLNKVHSYNDVYVKVSPVASRDKVYYKITPISLGNGSLNYTVPFSVEKGDTIVINATPESGYKVVGLYMNNVYMATNQTEYKFKNITKDIKIEVLFRKIKEDTLGVTVNHSLVFNVGSNVYYADGIEQMAVDFIQVHKDMPYVPIATLLSYLNIPEENINWNASDKTLTYCIDNTVYKLIVGQSIIYRNGEAIDIKAPIGLLNQRLVIPLSALSSILSEYTPKAIWDKDRNLITITLSSSSNTSNTKTEYSYFF